MARKKERMRAHALRAPSERSSEERSVRQPVQSAEILGVEERPRFGEYVIHEHPHAYRYSGDLRIGAVLPGNVTYYDVPAEYHVAGYRYAYVNDRVVLVEPRTRRIVEIE